jgi:type VI secretion system secreted protein VgrG
MSMEVYPEDYGLRAVEFNGHEELSKISRLELTVTRSDSDLNARDVVGKGISLRITDPDENQRWFHGLVVGLRGGAIDSQDRREYHLSIRPALWLTSQSTDCRIFQDKTVVEIVEEVLKAYDGLSVDLSQVTQSHPKREYCVQYRESDLDFLARLLEEEGIFYFFDDTESVHRVIFGDQPGVHSKIAQSPVDYRSNLPQTDSIDPHLKTWERRYSFGSGKWTHTDYDFKQPRSPLMVSQVATGPLLPDTQKHERYDFPGRYSKRDQGEPLAKIRAEQLACEQDLIESSSDCISFKVGGYFKVGEHRNASERSQEFVIRRIEHRCRVALSENSSSGDQTGPEPYRNQLLCFPRSVPFRPAQVTPQPVVRGCQTAVVTGPRGEEIYPDEYGRVKVKFHWDRLGKPDENSSCWIRVSQVHAGQKWGQIDLPRVGEEVIVDFLEGNPDQPIIVGRVYNGDNKPPFDLPKEKTRRGNRSSTYKGNGFNELSMDDTPGREQVRIHAQHNWNSSVNNDQTTDVKNNQSIQVGNDRSLLVGNDDSTQVKNEQTVKVDSDRSVYVGGSHTETVKKKQTVEVGDNQKTTVKGSHSLEVKRNSKTKVALNASDSVGISRYNKTGVMKKENVGLLNVAATGVLQLDATGFFHADVAAFYRYIRSGHKLKIKAGTSIEISCGSSTIELTPDKISISSTNIEIAATGVLKAEGKTVSIRGSNGTFITGMPVCIN